MMSRPARQPDPRTAWGVVEHLALTGEIALAAALADLLAEVDVAAALRALAAREGVAGGEAAAREAALDAIDLARADLSRRARALSRRAGRASRR